MPILCPSCTIDKFKNVYLSNCTLEKQAQFQSIWFQLDNYMYEMPPSSYLIVGPSTKTVVATCYLKFGVADDKNFGLLGITFLENFTQYYSLTNNQLALIPSNPATATTIEIKNHNAIVIGVLVPLTLVACCLLLAYSIKLGFENEKEENKPNADPQNTHQLAEQ